MLKLKETLVEKEFKFRNIKLPLNEVFSANDFEHNRELEEYKIADKF